jgi:hypothetical protein
MGSHQIKKINTAKAACERVEGQSTGIHPTRVYSLEYIKTLHIK